MGARIAARGRGRHSGQWRHAQLRWAGKGHGKRGGLRVIYYWRDRKGEIWLLTLYAKNEAENIPLHVLRELRKEIEP